MNMFGALVKKYLQLAKPTMVAGNLVAAAGGYFLAARGTVDGPHLLLTLTGIGLVIAAACVCNNCIDRQVDRKMARTRNRALASGKVGPRAALVYAGILGLGGAAVLWTFASALSLAIVLAGFADYVIFYTLLLKRISVYSTLVGSLAGAAPALAGYCAVNPHIDAGALILLAIFSLWQIPHTYAIAVFRLQDYTDAAIPLLPVRRGTAAARRHIIGYILAFALAAPLLSVCGYTGNRYLAVAALVGLAWLALAWTGQAASDDSRWARRLFVFSLVGITALSLMMAVDPVQAPVLAGWLMHPP